MQAHLEVRVDGDLLTAVDRAIELGATLAAYQPQDDVRVLLDPAGHPFCLWVPN
ncbi:MAG: VOC family protein [Candidatus Phosphoribacter baldrii]